MVGCRPPPVFQYGNVEKFLHCKAAPVLWCARGPQPALTLTAVLITQHLRPPVVVPTQSVWTEQSRPPVINGSDGAPTNTAVRIREYVCSGKKSIADPLILPEYSEFG
jgi:hypothetical protein